MKKSFLFFTLIFFQHSILVASTFTLAPNKGKVTFLAKGRPSLISIRGEGEGIIGKLTKKDDLVDGFFDFQLKSLKTGIDLRDEHMKEKYLEVEKFPIAKLTISNLKIPSDTSKLFKFNGLLTLHGVEQAIEGEAEIAGSNHVQTLNANFEVKLSQFQIPIPSFQGITVAEVVRINVESPVAVESPQ